MRKPEVCSFDTLRCYFERNQEMYVLWKGVEGGQKRDHGSNPRGDSCRQWPQGSAVAREMLRAWVERGPHLGYCYLRSPNQVLC